MTEHLYEKWLTLTFHWHAAVQTEDDGARMWVGWCRQVFAEFELLLFTEEVEESGSVDDRDVSP